MHSNEETSVNERIQQIINHYKLNKSSFSREIGLGNSMTIGNIVGGRKSKPGYDILYKIVERFPVCPAWLLTGKGPMLQDAEKEMKSDTNEVDKTVELILKFPEKFEKNATFANYIESKCNKAIIEHQDKLLLAYRKLSLDQPANS